MSADDKDYYFKVTVSSSPVVQPNSASISFMRDSCEPENILLSEYVINGTNTDSLNGLTLFYYCINQAPYYVTCLKNECHDPVPLLQICVQTVPFYNSSSSNILSSSGGTGIYSGSNSGSFSGNHASGGGSSGASGFSSGGGSSSGKGNNLDQELNSSSNQKYYFQHYCS
ncbi:hypothetical protein DICPUDRAFT_74455 [Dictyostelium purpureum]|nr:uncharacterized protein DICPUDRAFT_74455 [Dictyostelium purpureum]EGC39998.1 hypothetical protein DICPUDRAFT_74455 [Dictyostelium purpureum]|eukprot:XP_003283501.1 hypothetical protein DICPUDRAFT_74455 [Dictyostelium purpureum]